MNYKASLSTNDRPIPIQDETDAPNLDPIRDGREPLLEPPRNKPAQMGEGSYEGTEKYAEGISNYLKTADVQADAKAAAPSTPREAAELEKAEAEGKAAIHGNDMRDF